MKQGIPRRETGNSLQRNREFGIAEQGIHRKGQEGNTTLPRLSVGGAI
jgi:hypothetical protein